ncbi:MAG: M48 family metalloprotease [Trichodesmium sp. MAG_R03]|nr:M48 family metalloprotease [Trichodesmium sp. MAG_R03]
MIDNTSSAQDDYVAEKPSLKTGLLALKQKDYSQAIAHLEIIAQQEPIKQKFKAQMGLVIAYERTKQIDKAIYLCRNLAKISHREIKSFANRHLKELLKRYPPKNIKKSTIIAPKTSETSPQNQQPIETGFVPFHPTSDTSTLTPDKNSSEISKQNIGFSLETGYKPISKKTNNLKTNSTPKTPETYPQNKQHIETGFAPFNPTLNKSKSDKSTDYSSKQNLDLSVENDFKQISELPDIHKTNPSKNLDVVQNYQPKKNDIELNKNQSSSLSSLVNKSNSESTNESHQTFTEIAVEKSENAPKLKWREAGRAKGSRRLKSLNLTLLWLEQIVVIIVIFWLSISLLKFSLDATNNFLVWLPHFRPIQLFYRDPTRNFIIFILGLFILSPWLIDGLLILTYGLQSLLTTTLINYSKEANKLLRTFCKKHKIQKITLKVLPIDVPIAFSYGWLPRFYRIVVSQGLLDNLTEDEIATIYAREISHIQNGDFRLMSLANLMLQVPYTIYWQLTFWADFILDFINHQLPDLLPEFIKYFLPILVSVFRVFVAIISTLSYGLYWLLKLPILGLSRRRIYYSDRLACNLTGNPNGLTRALLKITIGMANDVENQGKVRNLLESFAILMPVGINQAITAGSVISYSGFESIFNWDIVNPYRRWLEINNSHPLLGDRLKRLGLYANFWKLETELNFENINVDITAKNQFNGTQEKRISIPQNLDWQKLLLQGAPFLGILIGLGFAIFLWLIGVILSAVGFWRLDWLFGDISILVGCSAMGFSIGILMRINHFFPDLKLTKLWQNPDLLELLSDIKALPLDSQVIQLKGQLIGKSGMSNWLGQDLILQTTMGLVRLHYSNQLGPLGNLCPQINRPADFIGKSITVTGWWRRGATPWIDINTLKTEHGQSINSGHPIWSTIVAFAIAMWGTYMVCMGRF